MNGATKIFGEILGIAGGSLTIKMHGFIAGTGEDVIVQPGQSWSIERSPTDAAINGTGLNYGKIKTNEIGTLVVVNKGK